MLVRVLVAEADILEFEGAAERLHLPAALVFLHLIGGEHLGDGMDGLEAPGKLGVDAQDGVQRGQNGGEESLVHDHIAHRNLAPVSHNTGEAEAQRLEQGEHHPAGGAEQSFGNIQPVALALQLMKGIVHLLDFKLVQPVGPGDGNHLHRLRYLAGHMLDMAAEFPVAAADSFAEGGNQDGPKGNHQDEEGRHRQAFGKGQHNGDQDVSDGRDEGIHHLFGKGFNGFHITEHLGLKLAGAEIRMIRHGQMLQLADQRPPQSCFHLPRGAAHKADMNHRRGNVLDNDNGQQRQVNPQPIQIIRFGSAQAVDHIRGNDRDDPGRCMFSNVKK
ncbi:hypothetical protein D3C75_723000 [compost metagenome]